MTSPSDGGPNTIFAAPFYFGYIYHENTFCQSVPATVVSKSLPEFLEGIAHNIHFNMKFNPRDQGPVSKWSLGQDLLLKLRNLELESLTCLSLSSKSCLKLHLETGPRNYMRQEAESDQESIK